MTIDLPQASPGEVVLSVFEGDPVALTVVFVPPAPEMIVAVSLTVSDRGNEATSIIANNNAGTITVSGSFTGIFDQQTFRVLDWKDGEDYVLPKVYTIYTNLTDTENDLNWDNLIAFTPDPRQTVPVTFSGTVTTEMDDPENPMTPIVTNYPYSFNINVNQQLDNNRTVVEALVARSATE